MKQTKLINKEEKTIKKLEREVRILKELYDIATFEWDWIEDTDGMVKWLESDITAGVISKQAVKYLIKWKQLKRR